MQVELGQYVASNASRDAVHVAIAPVEVPGPGFKPGMRVGIDENGVISRDAEHIGILDPFHAPGEFAIGCYVYLCMYPNTITDMKHVWKHPSFTKKSESEQWIRNFIGDHLGYEQIMTAADRYWEWGNYTMDNSESYSNIQGDWREFWFHYAVVRGVRTREEDSCPFSCSC